MQATLADRRSLLLGRGSRKKKTMAGFKAKYPLLFTESEVIGYALFDDDSRMLTKVDTRDVNGLPRSAISQCNNKCAAMCRLSGRVRS